MNNELEWERVIQWAQSEYTYLLHVLVEPQQITIEIEDKYSGDLWLTVHTSSGIQDLTTKAKNPKKYPTFIKMLQTALSRSLDSVSADILTYRELSSRFVKPTAQQKNISPQQAAKRFFVLSYSSQFQKMQFPIPMTYQSQVSSDRMKLTIRRMAQQIQFLKEGHQQNSLAKDLSILRYENQTLKAKLKYNNRLENSTMMLPKIDEMEKQLLQRNNNIQALKTKIDELQKGRAESDRKLIERDEAIRSLQKQLNDKNETLKSKDKKSKKQTQNQQKVQTLIKQMEQLADELQYARQKEKKSDMKITTLQNQLEKMMMNKPTREKVVYNRGNKNLSPESRNGDKESVKSGKSNQSNKSNKSNKSIGKGKTPQNISHISKKTYGMSNINQNQNNNKRQLSNRKSSLYDSDTQSSRMRRMNNGRSSPYRQSTAINNNKKTVRPNNQRSRSKSRQRVTSPRPIVIESQMFTQGDPSQDSSDQHIQKIDNYLRNLKQKKGAVKIVNKGGSNSNGTRMQNRLQTLQQMIKKAAMSTKTK